MTIVEKPIAEVQESDNVIDRIRKEIGEVPMGDVLLGVFDQFTDPSKIIIYEGLETANKKLVANIEGQGYPISLMVECLGDNNVRLIILNTIAECYCEYKNTRFLNEYVEFLAGIKDTVYSSYDPSDNAKTYGISMQINNISGLLFPSGVSAIVLKISQAVCEKSSELYQMRQPWFCPDSEPRPLPLRNLLPPLHNPTCSN